MEPFAHGFVTVVQDVGLQYMTDARLPEDQLFLVAEADFRLAAKHCAGDQWLAAAAAAPSGSSAAASSGGASRPPTSQPGSPPHSTYGPWEAQQRHLDDAAFPQSLVDLVRMVNCAGRQGVGSVVWLGYNAAHAHSAKPPRPSQINFGANLVALTRGGAASILHLMTTALPRHFDNWLLDVLQQHASGEQPTVRASYVNPAIGAFETHESGCGELSVRTGTFGRPWVWEGTRLPRGTQRWLLGFKTKQQPVPWLMRLDETIVSGASRPDIVFIPRPEQLHMLDWLTQLPPNQVHHADITWRSLLEKRGWLQDDEWIGPAKGHGKASSSAAGKGKGKGKGKRPPPFYEQLVAFPDQCNPDSVITRLAEQVVCDAHEFDWNAPHTDRVWSCRKTQLRLYKLRKFAVLGAFRCKKSVAYVLMHGCALCRVPGSVHHFKRYLVRCTFFGIVIPISGGSV